MEYNDPRDFGFRPETVMTALMPYEQYSSKTRRLILGIDSPLLCRAFFALSSKSILMERLSMSKHYPLSAASKEFNLIETVVKPLVSTMGSLKAMLQTNRG